MNERILITGASGIVGGRLSPLINSLSLFTPSHLEMDLTNAESVFGYVQETKPTVIVHAAAFINIFESEKERGDKSGRAWKTNVEGTRLITEAAKQVGAYVVYLSTGSVFSGRVDDSGPFSELDMPAEDTRLSWYAVTKKYGELYVKDGAVVRLSHPIGGRKSPNQKRDYLEKMIDLYLQGKLYPLFTDVLFPITYLPDLVVLLRYLIKKRATGIYHPVSETLTSAYQLFSAIEPSLPDSQTVQQIQFGSFIAKEQFPMMYSQYYAMDGKKTCSDAGIPSRTWQEIVTLAFQDTSRSLQ